MWNVRPASVAAMAVLTSAHASAALTEFPSRPLRYIVATGPGGASDIIARTLGPALSELLGAQIVIDNRPGAGNTIGAEIAARASPDGHTLLSCNIASLAVGPALYRKLGYDPERDFAGLGMIASNPNVLTINPSVPAKTIGEFIALAKSRPGQILYSSSGNGSAPHLQMALLTSMAGLKLVHVPYKGGAPQVTALVAGEAQVSFATIGTVINQIRAGRLRPNQSAARAALPGACVDSSATGQAYAATQTAGRVRQSAAMAAAAARAPPARRSSARRGTAGPRACR